MKKQRLTVFPIVILLALVFLCGVYKINAEETRKIYVDSPKISQVYNNSDVNIYGWALDKSTINRVEIYKDGVKLGNAEYGISRPDVNKAYPGYPSGDNAGYKITLSKNSISNGYHTIKVKAIGINSGYLEKSVQILMKKLPQRLYIDEPTANQNYKSENIRVYGWTLNNSGINKVEVYLDNQLKGQATYGLSRPDVNKAYPGYPSGDYPGYLYNMDVNSVSAGSHTVKVKAIGIDGGISETYKYISVTKLPLRTYIDSPFENQLVTNKSLELSGWALNPSGIKSINVYVDDNIKGQAIYGSVRSDVNKVYPGYPSGENCAYCYDMDVSILSLGSHTVKVAAVGNDGTTSYYKRSISVKRLTPKIYIDYPKSYAAYNNKNIYIYGWALNPAGVKNVEIQLDGKLFGQATYGLSRTDVNQAYPGYPSGNNPGYTYNIDVNLIAPGSHTIKVISDGNDGTIVEASKNITVTKLPTKAYMDSPNLSKYYNDITVRGWALNPSCVTKVDVLLDGKVVGQANYGLQRDDVNAAYPGYPSGNYGGYSYIISKDTIANGNHTVEVKVYGKDGTCQSVSKTIVYEKLDDKVKIESPVINYTSNNQDISIKGYALIPSGTKKIEVILDNNKIGEAAFGLSRSDLNTLYPQYPSSTTSGYNYNLDIDTVAPGTHNLNITAYGIDGTSVETASSFIVIKPISRIYVDYPAYNASYYMEDISVSGWALNASGVKSVKIYLNDKIIGQATLGLTRLDVDKAYPGYKGGTTSGYSYLISKSLLSTGSYVIKAEQIGYDGTVLTLSKTISVDMDKSSTVMASYDYQIENALLKQLAVHPQTWVSGIGWTNADIDGIRYYLDPNNFKDNDVSKYQFLLLNYTPGITLNEINTILSGRGVLNGCGSNFLNASIANNVSVAYAVSHALLETGNGTSQLAMGVLVSKVDGAAVTPKVVYNMFGIGAYDSDPIRYGAEYAYKKGWFNKALAIEGGIKWISSDYINNSYYNQNTLYKMRWNPTNPATHQYATDIKWAASQTSRLKSYLDLYPNAKLVFEIPSYK